MVDIVEAHVYKFICRHSQVAKVLLAALSHQHVERWAASSASQLR